MEGKAIKSYPPRKEPFSLKPWIWVILVSVLIITSLIGYYHWKCEIQETIQHNRLMADSVARVTLERHIAIKAVIQSYCLRPLLIRAVKNRDSAEVLRHLLNLKANHPEIDGLYISDPQGTLWLNFPLDKKSHGKNFSHRDWYQGVSKEWKPYISAAYRRIIDPQDLAVAICAPIFDEEGKTIGILGAVQSVSSFKFIAELIEMESDLKVTLIDQKGQVIFSNRFVVGKEIFTFPIPSLLEKALRDERGQLEFQDPSDGGRKKYIACAPVGDTGWSVIVEKGQKEILAEETKYFIPIALAGLLFFSTMVLILAYLRKGWIIRQMTEERKTAEMIQKMNETLKALIQASPLAIIALNRERKVELWSPAAERIFGWSEKEVLGFPLPFLSQNQQNAICWNLSKILNEEMISAAEFRCLRKDGLFVEISVSTAALRDSKGNIVGNMAIIEDITRRKRDEDALRREKERAQKYLDTAGVMLVAIDATQKVSLINRRGCEILGYREEDVIGKNWFDHFLPQRDRERVKSIFIRLMAGEVEPIEYFENPIVTKGGEERIIAWHNTILTDDEGKITATLSSGEDITERKLAEEKIHRSLMEKEIMLKEIHHRVKNNLQIICSLLNWQSRYIQDPSTLEMFRESQNRVRSMALIHERLYQAKDLARINFREYVQSLIEQLFQSYREQDGNISLQIDVEDIPLGVDKAIPCAMILNELVSNSFKHGFPPGSQGVISISFKAPEEGRLLLGVKDNGIGPSKNFNLYSPDSLGCQLVNALTNQLGGSIEMDGTEGTEIRIIFPA